MKMPVVLNPANAPFDGARGIAHRSELANLVPADFIFAFGRIGC
jgi:hypothetical protein